MWNILNLFRKSGKARPSIFYRMHYLNDGVNSAAYHTGALQ